MNSINGAALPKGPPESMGERIRSLEDRLTIALEEIRGDLRRIEAKLNNTDRRQGTGKVIGRKNCIVPINVREEIALELGRQVPTITGVILNRKSQKVPKQLATAVQKALARHGWAWEPGKEARPTHAAFLGQ